MKASSHGLVARLMLWLFMSSPCKATDYLLKNYTLDNVTEANACSNDVSCEKYHGGKWDRMTCSIRINAFRELEPNEFKHYENREYFFEDENGTLQNNPENMVLTVKGCDAFCGKQTFYWDAPARLTTWIIPVVLLLSNIEMSPIDRRRFVMVLHALGDPIDTFWSILHKLYVWRRLHAIALHRCLGVRGVPRTWGLYISRTWSRLSHWLHGWHLWLQLWKKRLRRWKVWRQRHLATRFRSLMKTSTGHVAANTEDVEDGDGTDDDEENEFNDEEEDDRDEAYDRARVIATVLAGFEEISGSEIKSEIYYQMVMTQLGRIGTPNESEDVWQHWRSCARVLADSRTNEVSRTLLSIFIYVFGVAGALYEDLGGGNTSKPGGRIGSAVFLMWLVPLALLTNTVGTFTSRRTCLTIMRLFVERCREAMRQEEDEQNQPVQSASSQHDQSTSNVGGVNKPRGGTDRGSDHSDINRRPPAHHRSPSIVVSRSDEDRLTMFNLPSPAMESGEQSSSNASPNGSPGLQPRLPGNASPGSSPRLHPRLPGHGRSSSDYDFPPQRVRGSSVGRPSTPRSFLWPGYEGPIDRTVPNELVPPPPVRPRSRTMQPHRTRPTDLGVAFVDVSLEQEAVELPLTTLPPIAMQPPISLSDPVSRSAPITPPNGHRRASSEVDPLDLEGRRASTSFDLHEVTSPASLRSDMPLISPHLRTPNFRKDPAALPPPEHEQEPERVTLLQDTRWHLYFNWMQPLGAIYTYRPWKLTYRSVSIKTHAHFTSNWSLFVLALMPVAFSAIGAFIIIFHAVPVGFSCRSTWLVGVTVAWLASVAITTGLHHKKPLSDRTIWVLITIKDAIIGVPGLLLVFLSTTGMFNNCYCWSSQMWHTVRRDQALVPLNTEDVYDDFAEIYYGPVVWTCLSLQILFFFVVVCTWWEGIHVIRWNEERCIREWRHEVSNGRRKIDHDTDDLYLLFWYNKDEFDTEENRREQKRRQTLDDIRRSSSRFSISPSVAAFRRATGLE